MSAPRTPLDSIGISPERKVFNAVLAHIRANALVAASFTIVAIESPSFDAFLNYGAYSMAVQPVPPRPTDLPSRSQNSKLGIHISAYLPSEDREEDTKALGLDLGGHLRFILWGVTYPDPDNPGHNMNTASTAFRQMPTIIPPGGGIRILTYELVVELYIDPTQADFIE